MAPVAEQAKLSGVAGSLAVIVITVPLADACRMLFNGIPETGSAVAVPLIVVTMVAATAAAVSSVVTEQGTFRPLIDVVSTSPEAVVPPTVAVWWAGS